MGSRGADRVGRSKAAIVVRTRGGEGKVVAQGSVGCDGPPGIVGGAEEGSGTARGRNGSAKEEMHNPPGAKGGGETGRGRLLRCAGRCGAIRCSVVLCLLCCAVLWCAVLRCGVAAVGDGR